MEVSYEQCCGLDVHKQTVVACLLTPGQGGRPRREVRTFRTFTSDLLEMADWLGSAGCTHIAMESTGSYWKPVYNLLEGQFELLVVNAAHLKQVPGRKTDVKDAEWIADLLRHGLLRASFIPGRAQRELRELVRYRGALVSVRTAEVNRIQKVLEGANIKLASVATNVLGMSGRAMLEQMVLGNSDPSALAELAVGKLRKKRADLELALTGLLGPHQRFLLGEQLTHLDDLDRRIARIGEEIAERLAEAADDLERLDGIPGVGVGAAETILAEIGADLAAFATADHLTSWAGVCPGMNQSGGKNRPARAPKGSRILKAVLVQAAHACRPTDTFLGSMYRRLSARIGRPRAALAVARHVLVIAYHLLREKTHYRELGSDHYDRLDRERVSRRLTKRLERLGYEVALTPATAR